MTQQELQALIDAAVNDAGYKCEPHRFRVGDEDHLAGPDGLSQWMGVLDDRTPDSDGPASFDGPALVGVLRSAIMVVLDHAPDPDRNVYDFLARATAFGNRVLIIQTTEGRRDAWRKFLSERFGKQDIAEIVPVKDCPAVSGRLCFTRSDRRIWSRRKAGSKPARGAHAAWATPWGPATRLTRIAAGIEFFETATSTCYRLTPARNAEVPEEWRRVACPGEDGWYSEHSAAIVTLAFPQYFGAEDIAAARAKFATTFAAEIAARSSL